MEFRHLRYFLALSEELHFGRAAERLAISQPPLSWNIRQLEESLGARLFDRNSRGVRLTEAGKALVPAARALLSRADEAARLVRDVECGLRGQLRVGYVSSMMYRGLPALLHAFEAQATGMRVQSFELNSQEQLVELTHERIDVGFVHTAGLPRGLARERLASERFWCCLPQGHALAGAARLAAERLRDETFVMFSRQASPDYHERILTLCTQAGFVPEIRHEVRHWPSVVTLVAQGFGVALVPEAVRQAASAGVVFVPLQAGKLRSTVHAVWRQGDENPALLVFLRQLRERLGAVAPG